jgi:hypothetical protein
MAVRAGLRHVLVIIDDIRGRVEQASCPST